MSTTYEIGDEVRLRITTGSGAYYHLLTLTQAGRWRYRWTGTGAVKKTTRGAINVGRELVP